jgi:hypothetical protein
MTVQELMNILSTYEPTAEVRFADTYAQNEGWMPGYENATCEIGGIHWDVAECAVILEENF